MTAAIQLFASGMMALGLVVSLVGRMRSKPSKLRWGHYLAGMGLLGVGILTLQFTGFYAG